MTGSKADCSLYEFFAGFLPEFEFCLSSMSAALAKLDELREFYELRGRPLASYRNPERRIIVLPMGTTNWEVEAKSAILFADNVICDDPLLYIADMYTSRIGEKRFANYNYDEANLEWLRGQLGAIWRVLPLVQGGVLNFHYLRRRPSSVKRAIEHAVRSYLESHMEITGWSEPNTYPYYVELYVPLLDFRGVADISKGLLNEDILFQEQAIRQYLPPLAIHSLSAIEGLQGADLTAGTLWTSSDWIWKLSRDAVGSLSPRARIYSFFHDLQRPALESVPAADLIRLRTNDEAMHTFRRELRLADGLITCDPDNDGFENQVRQVFHEVFMPSLENIERSMKRNRAFTQLPWLTASTGFAYAAAATSSNPALPGIFAAMSAAAGFSGLFKTLFDSESPVRREPAFVLWKVADLARGSKAP